MTKLANIRAALLVAAPGVLAGLASSGVSKTSSGLTGFAARVEKFADRFKARCLRIAARAFEKHAAFLVGLATTIGEKATDLREVSARVFSESKWATVCAECLREEADDLDPPAPVIAEKKDGEVSDSEV